MSDPLYVPDEVPNDTITVVVPAEDGYVNEQDILTTLDDPDNIIISTAPDAAEMSYPSPIAEEGPIVPDVLRDIDQPIDLGVTNKRYREEAVEEELLGVPKRQRVDVGGLDEPKILSEIHEPPPETLPAEELPIDQSMVPLPVYRSKRSIFEFGNYDRYYNYRHETQAFVDSRLSAIMQYLGGDKLDFFHDKTVLDIGCNIGFITFYVAYILGAHRVVGIDIDHTLIDQALRQLRKYKHDGFPLNEVASSSLAAHKSPSLGRRKAAALEPTFPIALTRRAGVPPITNKVLCVAEKHVEEFVKPYGKEKVSQISDRFPFNIEFRTEDISEDTVDIDVNDGSTMTVAAPCSYEKEKYDVVLLLSVIKWIQYHKGDDGVKHVFKKIYDLLKPGGLFIFEPQDWKSYRKKRNLTREIRNNYNSIKLRPAQFIDYLEKEVGFRLECTLKPSQATPACDVRGFDRPLHLLRKPAGECGDKKTPPTAEVRKVEPDRLVDVESAKVVHGSRMSSKMSEAFLSSSDGDNLAYCSFNTNGVPNSDGDFYDKTLIKDVADLEAVTSWLREHLRSLERIFLIGFSTGAFLSVCAPVMTNVVSEKSRALLKGVISIACLSDPHIGAKLDFNQEQITACQETGECLVKFWPLLEVEVNVGTGEVMNNKGIEEASKPEPVEWRLSRAYYDSYLDLPARTEITKHWPEKLPLLLVHGTGDVLVPNEMSAELQKAFPVDTTVTRITVAGANHFFSSQKDMKKLQLAVKNFCHDLNAQTTSSLAHEDHNCRPVTESLAAKLRHSLAEGAPKKCSEIIGRGVIQCDAILNLADKTYQNQDARLTDLEKEILSAVGERFKELRKLLRLQDEQVRSDVSLVREKLLYVVEAESLLETARGDVEGWGPREVTLVYGMLKKREKEVTELTANCGKLCRTINERKLRQFLNLDGIQELLDGITRFGSVSPWKNMIFPIDLSRPDGRDGMTERAVDEIWDFTGGSGLGQFRSPYSVCNHAGKMFISDSLNHRVQVFDTNTLELQYTIGQRGDGEGEFCDPSGIGVDKNGRIIVAEYGNDRIQIFDNEGKFLQCCGSFGSGQGEFYGPFGVHICPATQNLLITDSCNHRVQVLSPTGKFLFAFGRKGSAPGEFLYPEGIGTTIDGSFIIVSDKDNGRIQVFTQKGEFVRQITTASEACGALSGPLGVAADVQGRLYCCDCGNSRIVCIEITGEVLWSSDSSNKNDNGRQQQPYTFPAPTGVCIDPSGTLYVVCDHAVMIFGREARQR
ncbi:hypothetical protein FOL47_004495, partial [Perkinsus chesapeaki]